MSTSELSKLATGEPSREKASWVEKYVPFGLPDDSNHPAQIALRTYAVSLSLSLGPALLPFVISLFSKTKKSQGRAKSLKDILKRELGPNGFAFAITVAVGGGAAIQRVWETLEEYGWDAIFDSTAPPFGTPEEDSTPAADALEPKELYRKLRRWIASQDVSSSRKAFASNLISSTVAILLLQGRRARIRPQVPPFTDIHIPMTMPLDTHTSKHGPSPTLDLTLLLLVRAIDATIQSLVFKRSETYWPRSRNLSTIDILGANGEILVEQAGSAEAQKEKRAELKWRDRMTTRIDALMFWACCTRIMWCFFYEPRRLPASYDKWINSLAKLDIRVLDTLRAIRANKWSYIKGSLAHGHLLRSLAEDLGRPASWGDPTSLPAYGGDIANAAWKSLGVTGRAHVGGLPCELVHGRVAAKWGLGDGCTANASARFGIAFVQAILLYLPVHFLPILVTRPSSILRLHRIVIPTALRAVRSAAFLSTFVSSCWFGVCFARSLFLAKLFPSISHDFWDGPFGGMFFGSLICGGSIWIENGKRRGEMALYVLPRAVRSLLPYKWMRSGDYRVRLIERIVFVVSLASLLSAAVHRPDSLRGLSRWTFAFVMRGPNAGFWKRRKIMAQTPSPAQTPRLPSPTHLASPIFLNTAETK